MEKPVSSFVLKYFLLLFAISILLAGKLLWPFCSILVLSFLLINIFKPLYSFFIRHMSDYFASFLTCGLIVILVFVPLTFFVGALSTEAIAYFHYIKDINFVLKTKEFIQNSSILLSAQEYLKGAGFELKAEDLGQHLTDSARMLGLFFYNQASAWAGNIINFIINFALMILIIFFMLVDYDRLVNFVLRLSPLPDDQERELIKKFQEISMAILLGNGICGALQGVLGGLVFAYFDISSPILWGGVMAVMAFLPIVGIGVILLPTALIFLLKGSIGTAIFITVFYFVLSMGVEYLLKPKLVGRQVKMPTLLVFLSIIGGLSTFGVLGIIYGPLIITAFLTMADIYLKNYDQHVTQALLSASSTQDGDQTKQE